MADFAIALKSWLKADAELAALTTELHWVSVPQAKAPPYIRLQTINDPRPQHLKAYDAMRVSRVQVDCFAKSWGLSRAIAEAIVNATAQPATHGGFQFGKVQATGPKDLGEVKGTDFIFRASLDLLVAHKSI